MHSTSHPASLGILHTQVRDGGGGNITKIYRHNLKLCIRLPEGIAYKVREYIGEWTNTNTVQRHDRHTKPHPAQLHACGFESLHISPSYIILTTQAVSTSAPNLQAYIHSLPLPNDEDAQPYNYDLDIDPLDPEEYEIGSDYTSDSSNPRGDAGLRYLRIRPFSNILSYLVR